MAGLANSTTKTIHYFYLAVVALVLIFAPLFRAANRPLPLLIIEILSFILLIKISRDHFRFPYLSRGQRWYIALLFVYPLFFLIPIPFDLWQALPGRGLYAQSMQWVTDESSHNFRAISIFPIATEASWYALFPALAIFLTIVVLPRRLVSYLIFILLSIAAIQAALALIQYGDGPNSIFRLGNPNYLDSGVGTYANRNHLAGLLEMTLPLALALLVATACTPVFLATPREKRIRNIALYAFVSVLLLLGLVFTRSRTGIALGTLGIIICGVLYAPFLGKKNAFSIMGGIGLLGFIATLLVGITPIWERFAIHDPFGDIRWSVYENAINAVGWFFPLGSGPGTFSYVYPRFQAVQMQQFVNHAHNDYLEWIIEGGLLAVLLISFFLFFYSLRWVVIWKNSEQINEWLFVQIGAGIGLLLLMLHGLTDFNFHIPANAIIFGFLSGIFFHTINDVAPLNKYKMPPEATKTESEQYIPIVANPPAVKNPFLD